MAADGIESYASSSTTTPEYDTESCSELIAANSTSLNRTAIDRMLMRHFRRPFRQFRLTQADFEIELGRKFNVENDMDAILAYMQSNCFLLTMVDFIDLDMSRMEMGDVTLLLHVLNSVSIIEFHYVIMPADFFEILNLNRHRMLINELVLEGLKLNMDEESELLDFIANSKTLQRLCFIACDVDIKFFTCIVSAIYKSNTIKEFESSQMLVDASPDSASDIANIVARLIWDRGLEEIKLQNCFLYDIDIIFICEFLGSEDCQLQRLDLAYNFLSCDCVEPLLKAIEYGNHITTINLAGNNLGSHGGELINRYIYRCITLRHIDIQYNNIGHETMNTLINTLVHLPYLETIRFSGNEFSTKTTTLLRRKIKKYREFADAIDIQILYDAILDQYVVISK